jgi:hypothetical protein
MVDFGKRLANKAAIKPVDPIEIYDRLDRAIKARCGRRKRPCFASGVLDKAARAT